MSNFIVNTDIPNLRVVIREGDQYNINIVPGRITTIRTGSFNTYADLAGIANTASYALTAQTLLGTILSSSYALTSSYAETASYAPAILPSGVISSSTQVDYTQIQNQPTTIPTASYVLNSVSASFALTASYVSGAASTWDDIANKPIGLVSSSLQINTGSFSGSFVGQLLGTASWATNTISSSYAQTSSLAYQVSVYTGSIAIGSTTYTGSFTGSFVGDGALLTNVASCIISGSPPTSNVEAGDLWYDDDSGKTYIYYTSASVSNWVLQSDPTYDPGAIIQAATASLALAIPTSAPVTPQTGSLYFSGSYLFIYDGVQYKSASLN